MRDSGMVAKSLESLAPKFKVVGLSPPLWQDGEFMTYLNIVIHIFVGFCDEVPYVIQSSFCVNAVTEGFVNINSENKETHLIYNYMMANCACKFSQVESIFTCPIFITGYSRMLDIKRILKTIHRQLSNNLYSSG